MVYLFYNPKSNAGKTEKEIIKYEQKLNKKGLNTIKINLMDSVETADILKEIAPNDIIVIAGGDGTVNWVLNHHLFDNITNKVYVYRSGRGNDYSRNFKKKFFEIEGRHSPPSSHV